MSDLRFSRNENFKMSRSFEVAEKLEVKLELCRIYRAAEYGL